MKKVILFWSTLALIAISTSCQKCATCTYNDPEKGVLETEVCSNGHAYESAIDMYESQNWECAK